MDEETKSLAATDDGAPIGSPPVEMRAMGSAAHAPLRAPSAVRSVESSPRPAPAPVREHREEQDDESTAAPPLREARRHEVPGDEARPPEDNAPSSAEAPRPSKKSKLPGNNVRKMRLERMMSKAELARRANLSVLTIDRVEKGYGCRMDTKRKILEALGLSLADRLRVFGEEE